MITAVLAAVATLTSAPAETSTVEFVVAEAVNQLYYDSYILPLSDPTHIRYARDIIRLGESADGNIAVCRIKQGSDGVNRNIIQPDEPIWSWHVVEFLGFAQTTAEIYDGSPTDVEQNPDVWFGPDGLGTIGFWAYTTTRELGDGPGISPPTTPSGPSLTDLGGGLVRVAWGDTSSNEEGFEFQREQYVNRMWTNRIMVRLGANSTSYDDSPGSGNFRYRVRSYNIAGSSQWTSWKSIKLR